MLKSLVALLLSKFVKRSDTGFIASQPMAGDSANRVALYSGTGNINYQGTAATNGFVWVTGGNCVNIIYLHNNRSGLSIRLEAENTMTQWPHLFLPCAKGDTWAVDITAPSQTQTTSIFFIPSIGG